MRATISMLTIFLGILPAIESSSEDGSKRSKEFQVLQQFLGTWDIINVVSPPGVESIKQKVVSRRTQSQGGKFIRFDDEMVDGGPEFHMLLTYDPVNNNYPATAMNGTTRIAMTGTWDEETRTMTFTGTDESGTRCTSTHRFINKDKAEASGTFTDARGNVLAKISCNQQRRKPE